MKKKRSKYLLSLGIFVSQKKKTRRKSTEARKKISNLCSVCCDDPLSIIMSRDIENVTTFKWIHMHKRGERREKMKFGAHFFRYRLFVQSKFHSFYFLLLHFGIGSLNFNRENERSSASRIKPVGHQKHETAIWFCHYIFFRVKAFATWNQT